MVSKLRKRSKSHTKPVPVVAGKGAGKQQRQRHLAVPSLLDELPPPPRSEDIDKMPASLRRIMMLKQRVDEEKDGDKREKRDMQSKSLIPKGGPQQRPDSLPKRKEVSGGDQKGAGKAGIGAKVASSKHKKHRKELTTSSHSPNPSAVTTSSEAGGSDGKVLAPARTSASTAGSGMLVDEHGREVIPFGEVALEPPRDLPVPVKFRKAMEARLQK